MSRRWPEVVRREVEAAGGSVSMSADGHLRIFDRQGRYLMKVRTAGKQVGDGNNKTGRSVLRGLVRRIEASI